MNLVELFSPYTNQEFPPKKVFVFVDDKPVSLKVKDLAEYDTMYVHTGWTVQQSNILGKPLNFPTLAARAQ